MLDLKFNYSNNLNLSYAYSCPSIDYVWLDRNRNTH